jgi:hypothetical protein
MNRFRCALAVPALAVLAVSSVWSGTVKPATVKLTKGDVTLQVTFEDGGKLLVTSKGSSIKPGTYWVKSISLFKKDKEGRTWEMRGAGSLGNMQNITVDEGQERILDIGPPIAFYGAPFRDKNKPEILGIRYNVNGKHGEGYFPGAFLEGGQPPQPAFRVISASGKTLLSDRFPTTRNNQLGYAWTIPREFSGKIRLEIKPVMGPFEWVTNEGEFEIKQVPP